MKWAIQNISIPVYDLEKSKQFYELFLGKTCSDECDLKNYLFSGNSIFFGRNNIGIRLFKLRPHLHLENLIQSHKSFVNIRVNNIDEVKQKLKKNNFIFNFLKTKNSKNLLFQEPSLNLIHLTENLQRVQNDNLTSNLNWQIHHMNLESNNVRNSIEFFCNIIGMQEGKWNVPPDMGNFSIDPKDLAILPLSKKNHGIHIIKADHGFAWRNKFIHNPSIGGHPAITVKNIKDITMKLKKRKILFTDAKKYAMPGFHQIYFFDDNSNMIEINQSI